MTPSTPVCSYANGLKTIKATNDADTISPGVNWSTWIISFTMDITNPTDIINFDPTLTTKMYNPNNNFIYAL
jgi:hypothetical protein